MDVNGKGRVLSGVNIAVDDAPATHDVWSELGSGLDRSGFGGELIRQRRRHDYQYRTPPSDTAVPATALVWQPTG